MWILKRRPLVSIIIASYNHAPFVANAVTSVLAQGIKDMEVIVVDDGSNDGTPEEIEKLMDPRVRLIGLKENRRVHPRNLALGLAKGQYIAFQNSDDEWDQGKLSAQLEVLEKNRQIVACFTGVDIIDEEGKQLSGTWANGQFTTDNRTSAQWLRHFFEKANCLCITSAVVRHRQIKEVGNFRPRLVQMSDLDLWIRLAGMGEFHIIEMPFTKMRIIADRNISRPSPTALRRSWIEFAEILGRYTERPVCDRIPEAFMDILPLEAQSPAAYLAGLAIYARSLTPAHQLFADRVFADILDDSLKREEIVRVYGTQIINDFINMRGKLEITSVNEEE